MSLPEPAARTLAHTRQVVFQGYARDDGLWDIEARMIDTKTYPLYADRGEVVPGQPIHNIAVRVTVDDAFVIREIAATLDSAPFGECQMAGHPAQKLVGATLGPGWRKHIEEAMGGVGGCTHLRELLFNVATAAYQTIPSYRDHQRSLRGEPRPASDEPPYHVGKCMSWDTNGTVVQRLLPQFIGWQPKAKR